MTGGNFWYIKNCVMVQVADTSSNNRVAAHQIMVDFLYSIFSLVSEPGILPLT
jgi:hypothetical protein